jgi:hypothetical protein
MLIPSFALMVPDITLLSFIGILIGVSITSLFDSSQRWTDRRYFPSEVSPKSAVTTRKNDLPPIDEMR